MFLFLSLSSQVVNLESIDSPTVDNSSAMGYNMNNNIKQRIMKDTRKEFGERCASNKLSMRPLCMYWDRQDQVGTFFCCFVMNIS